MRDADELVKKIEDHIRESEEENVGNGGTAVSLLDDDLPALPQGKCTDSQQHKGHPLLMLLDFPQAKGRTTIHGLQGKFTVVDDQIFFRAQTRQKNVVTLSSTFYVKKLLSLIAALQEKDYEMVLAGDTHNDLFYVYEFHIATAISAINKLPLSVTLSDGHLQFMLDRILGLRAKDNDSKGSPVFSTQEELRFLFRACQVCYPPAIRVWAERSFSSLNIPGLGSSDRRHTLKALSYILSIDWIIRPLNVPDITEVREKLDRQFYGLDTVKQRILEIAAQLRNTGSLPKWGILLNGPAGVGKTSVANAISDILEMPKAYLEFSVLRDSEALTGSSRIYDNGKPGLVIEQLYANRTANLVMVLNEIDKAVEGKQGSSPLDMLLPLLDGMGFTDTYIETTIPTNGIFFIATSNEADKISKPILDRFYRIDIPAYSVDEKMVIFDRHVLPQALNRARLDLGEVELSCGAKACLFGNYALEPGVRDLERVAEKLISNYLLKKEAECLNGISYTEEDLKRMLGPANVLERNFIMRPGMAFSAYLRDGRAHAFAIQAVAKPGRGRLELINVEGERLQEACQLAYECADLLTGHQFGHVDVVLAATSTLYDIGAGNYVGCAACAAILAAIQKREYSANDLFLGGCDLYGDLYLDERTIDPYLNQFTRQFGTIYGAVGMSGLIYESHPSARFNIVEAPNISILFQMAMISQKHR